MNGPPFVVRIPLFLLVITAGTLLAAGCGVPDVLVLVDQYWSETDVTEEIRKEIVSTARGNGTKLEFRLVNYPVGSSDVARIVEEVGADVTLLSPLLSQFAHELASQSSERRFVAFEIGIENQKIVDNLFTIGTDRSAAFMKAAALCRSYLDDPANEGMSVAAFFYSGGAVRSEERAAFLRGIGQGGVDRLISRSFPRLDAIGEVNEAISKLKDARIGLFFVSMSAITEDVVANISSRLPSLIITARVGASVRTAYHDRIVATIEERWIDAVSGSIKSVESDIFVDSILVPGPIFGKEAWMSGF